jgi:hypothetical protein
LTCLLVLNCRHVTTTALDNKLHFELALVVQGRNVKFGVVNLDAGRRLNVSSSRNARTLLAQVQHNGLVELAGDNKTLDVEDDLGDVFLNTVDGRELVQNTVDANACDCSTGNR